MYVLYINYVESPLNHGEILASGGNDGCQKPCSGGPMSSLVSHQDTTSSQLSSGGSGEPKNGRKYLNDKAGPGVKL